MATTPKAKSRVDIQKLLRDLAEAQEALERGEHEESRKMFERVRSTASCHRIQSGHVAWGLAIACDYLGDLEAAVQHIREALELDPLAAPFNRSSDIILQHIRAELLRPDRAADDESTPRLYQLLVQAGATRDDAVHLVQARHLLATDRRASALNLVEAVTALFPANSEAWLLRAEIAQATGDHDEAATARAQATALGEEPMPFTMPSRAEG